MKKLFILSLVTLLLLTIVSTGWCQEQETRDLIVKNLNTFYGKIKTGDVEGMKKMLTAETAKKVKVADNPNVLGNIDAVLGIADSVKNGEITVSIKNLKFHFKEVLQDKVVVITQFDMLLKKGDKEINNNGKNEVILLREGDKWLIMNLTDKIKE
ncbi:MAG: hypothetical protein K8T10_22335 [Candidatus Eremiobacteraeota bacterium]|nr:hypothetical protein [Candidatus Eremiobacteraeota bacterium]